MIDPLFYNYTGPNIWGSHIELEPIRHGDTNSFELNIWLSLKKISLVSGQGYSSGFLIIKLKTTHNFFHLYGFIQWVLIAIEIEHASIVSTGL